MSDIWNDLLLAFLHDPPDKALDIRGHEKRAVQYASAAFGFSVTEKDLHGDRSKDQWASMIERLPVPKAGEEGEHAVGPEGGELTVFHPLVGNPNDGRASKIQVCQDQERVIEETLRELTGKIEDASERFLAIWRLLPEKLAQQNSMYARLPADTRVPDHTIWHHMDTTAGLYAAGSGTDGAAGAALLSFTLGPVQPFIAAARSVRDLWTGSAILSWLTFQAMLPIIEKFGPTAILFPALRGTPLMDVWLRERKNLSSVPEPDKESRKAPCIPNRFVAVVPWGVDGACARGLATECEKAARDGWKRLCDSVHCKIQGRLRELCDTWDVRWDEQVESFFEFHVAVLPLRAEQGCRDDDIAKLLGKPSFKEAFPEAAAVRSLADAIPENDRPSHEQNSAGRWQAQLDLSSRLMESQRSVRHVPCLKATPDEGQFSPKCSLMGSYEQMGPTGLRKSREFWDKVSEFLSVEGVRLRKGERFCAIALAKRFAGPAFLAKELRLDASELRFPDTATVAAARWLKDADIKPEAVRRKEGNWSGQWLHWPRPDFDKDDECPREAWSCIQSAKNRMEQNGHGKPPAYYAILAMDADQMGRWLSGQKTPLVRDVYHPKMVEYFEGLSDKELVSKGLKARRPVGPALHAAISEALTNFAVHIVPRIVEKHSGTLIYAGGDDVLALLPTRSVLACARELQLAFRGETTEIEDIESPGACRAANGGAPCGHYRGKEGRDLLVMGPEATLSAGVAVVHYKEDLRLALDAARRAEKTAKDAGRDILQLTIWRRSGEHSSALCPWKFVERVEHWVKGFQSGASDRWAYHIAAEQPTLEGLEIEAIRAEMRRQFGRAEVATRETLTAQKDKREAARVFVEWFDDYHRAMVVETSRFAGSDIGPNGKALEQFITLCQSASFLARGRDL